MREILFRGKRLDNGKWIEGWYQPETTLIHHNGEEEFFGVSIAVKDDFGYLNDVLVDPNTIGQYTGVTDNNGKKIFEGDIVRMRHEFMGTEKIKGCFGYDSEGYPQKIPGYTRCSEYPKLVATEENFVVRFSENSGYYAEGSPYRLNRNTVTVVGNIHDNPDLLKGE